MKKILITGASGFVGTHLINKFGKNNFLYLIDKKKLKIKPKFKNFKFYKKDLLFLNNTFLEKIGKIDIIIHCASIIGINKVNNPFIIHSQIIGVTQKLLNFYKKKKIIFVYFSSSEIYGNQLDYSENKGQRIYNFNRNQKYKDIRWVYGESKFFIETCINFIRQKNKNFNYLIIRPFNFFGPYQDKNFVIPKMIEDLQTKKKITVYGDKKSIRTFTYIEDAIQIIFKLIINKKTYNNIFNIGSNNTLNIYDLSKKILKKFITLKNIKNKKLYKIIIDKKKKDPVIERKPQTRNIKTYLNSIKFSNFNKSLEKTIKSYF